MIKDKDVLKQKQNNIRLLDLYKIKADKLSSKKVKNSVDRTQEKNKNLNVEIEKNKRNYSLLEKNKQLSNSRLNSSKIINNSFKKEPVVKEIKVPKEKKICSLMCSFDFKTNPNETLASNENTNAYQTLQTNEVNQVYQTLITNENKDSRIITDYSEQIYQTPQNKKNNILKLKELKKNGLIKLLNTEVFKRIINDNFIKKSCTNTKNSNTNILIKKENNGMKEKKLSVNKITKPNCIESNKNKSIINLIENIKENKLVNLNLNLPQKKNSNRNNEKVGKKNSLSENSLKQIIYTTLENKNNNTSFKDNRRKNSREKTININHNINHNINFNINSKSLNISPNLIKHEGKPIPSFSIKNNFIIKENLLDNPTLILESPKNYNNNCKESHLNKKNKKENPFNENYQNGANIINELSNQLKMKTNKKNSRNKDENKSLPPKNEDFNIIKQSISKHNNLIFHSHSISQSRSNSKKESGEILSGDESIFTNLSRKSKNYSSKKLITNGNNIIINENNEISISYNLSDDASYYAKEPKVQNRSTTSVVGNNEDFLKFCEAINEKLLKNEF